MKINPALLLAILVLLGGCKTAPIAPSQPVYPDSKTQAAADAQLHARQGTESERERRREARHSDAGPIAAQTGEGVAPVTGFSATARPRRNTPAKAARPGQFDFYLLNLSWSPEFCATNPGSPECAGHPGFVLHGLWPQNTNGTFPEDCSSAPGPTSLGVLQGIIPTLGLLQHEWTTHGTCTGFTIAQWESTQRQAFTGVKVPAGFGTGNATLSPDAIVSAFRAANPAFPTGSIAVSCGNNRLTAIEVCMAKNLQPEACQGIRSCRANTVKITGRQ